VLLRELLAMTQQRHVNPTSNDLSAFLNLTSPTGRDFFDFRGV